MMASETTQNLKIEASQPNHEPMLYLYLTTDKFKDPRSLPKPPAPFLVSRKLVLVQTNGFAVILLHRLEDVDHALLSMKMSIQ